MLAITSKTWMLLLPAFVLAAGLGGMIVFKPMSEKEQALRDKMEQEIEEANDMDLVA